MTTSISREFAAHELRHAAGDALSSVRYRGERVGITYHGKLAAVLISVEDLELLEAHEEQDVR